MKDLLLSSMRIKDEGRRMKELLLSLLKNHSQYSYVFYLLSYVLASLKLFSLLSFIFCEAVF